MEKVTLVFGAFAAILGWVVLGLLRSGVLHLVVVR